MRLTIMIESCLHFIIKHFMKHIDVKAERWKTRPSAEAHLYNCRRVHDPASLLTAERGPGPRSGRAQATSFRLAWVPHLAADQLLRSLALAAQGAASPFGGPR